MKPQQPLRWGFAIFTPRTPSAAFPPYGLRGARNEGAAWRLLRIKTGETAQGTFLAEAKITINQLLNDFEKDYRTRGGRQLKKLQSHLKPVRESLGHLKVQDLTERRIRDYSNTRLDVVKSSTINREPQPLDQALRLAYDDRLIKRIPKIKLFPENTVRQGFFEYEDGVKLCHHLPDYLKDFVWFGYYSG